MATLTAEYWNTLANQLIVISTLLGGFSFATIFQINGIEANQKLKSSLFKAVTLSCAGFIISIFAMTNIIMRTTKGYPYSIENSDLLLPRIVGFSTFLIGLISILYIITISGRISNVYSKRFTLIVGIVSLILIVLMLN